jgi:hypothetical protein
MNSHRASSFTSDFSTLNNPRNIRLGRCAACDECQVACGSFARGFLNRLAPNDNILACSGRSLESFEGPLSLHKSRLLCASAHLGYRINPQSKFPNRAQSTACRYQAALPSYGLPLLLGLHSSHGYG